MKPTPPIYDEDGRIVARVSSTAMRHNHKLLAECARGHLYLVDPVELKRGDASECPRCSPHGDEREAA